MQHPVFRLLFFSLVVGANPSSADPPPVGSPVAQPAVNASPVAAPKANASPAPQVKSAVVQQPVASSKEETPQAAQAKSATALISPVSAETPPKAVSAVASPALPKASSAGVAGANLLCEPPPSPPCYDASKPSEGCRKECPSGCSDKDCVEYCTSSCPCVFPYAVKECPKSSSASPHSSAKVFPSSSHTPIPSSSHLPSISKPYSHLPSSSLPYSHLPSSSKPSSHLPSSSKPCSSSSKNYSKSPYLPPSSSRTSYTPPKSSSSSSRPSSSRPHYSSSLSPPKSSSIKIPSSTQPPSSKVVPPSSKIIPPPPFSKSAPPPTSAKPHSSRVTPPSSWSPSSSLSCGLPCQLDGFATLLAFPFIVVPSPYYLTTLDIHTTIYVSGTETVTSLDTTTINAPTPTSPATLTWEFNGVVLTYPTTYVAYTDFSHTSVQPVAGTCATSANDVILGQTNWASLIFPTASVPGNDRLPPVLVDYLDSLATVQQQLGGTIASSCDPAAAATQTPVAPTETLSTAQIVETPTVQDNPPTTSSVPAESAVLPPTTPPAPVTTNPPVATPPTVTTPVSSPPTLSSQPYTPISTTPTATTSRPPQQSVNAASKLSVFETAIGSILAFLLAFV